MDKSGRPVVVDLDAPKLVTPEGARRMRSRVVLLAPGEEVGEHVTEGKEEMIIVLEGRPTFIGGGVELEAGPGQAVYVPDGLTHNVKNRGKAPARYVYVLALHGDHRPGHAGHKGGH
jgi:mannose-6-phosphate isomerase-like protein (cupin superfamily)